jgi:hypothetical protein
VGRITRNADRVLRLAFFVAIVQQDAKAALGQELPQMDGLVEFAKRVKSFDLMTFLKTIKDVVERKTIKIDPDMLVAFSKSEAILQGQSTNVVQ